MTFIEIVFAGVLFWTMYVFFWIVEENEKYNRSLREKFEEERDKFTKNDLD